MPPSAFVDERIKRFSCWLPSLDQSFKLTLSKVETTKVNMARAVDSYSNDNTRIFSVDTQVCKYMLRLLAKKINHSPPLLWLELITLLSAVGLEGLQAATARAEGNEASESESLRLRFWGKDAETDTRMRFVCSLRHKVHAVVEDFAGPRGIWMLDVAATRSQVGFCARVQHGIGLGMVLGGAPDAASSDSPFLLASMEC